MLGIGKVLPIEKLLDVVSKSVGRISKSYFDRRDINTRAYEIKKIAEAKAEEIKLISEAVSENFKLTGGIDYKDEKIAISSPNETQTSIIEKSIEERTKERVDFQEEKKQLNIESITSYAAAELINEPPISDEPLDEDWTTRFFRIVEDISKDEMQVLWGKILAGEVKQPKSFSLRTLELVRNLSKEDADLFNKVAQFAICSGNGNYIFNGNDDNKLSEEFNIKYMDIAHLNEIGLIQSGDFVNHQFLQSNNDTKRVLIAGNFVLFVIIKANTPTVMMPVNVFSKSGNELLKLIKSEPPFEYLRYFANSIKNNNIEVKYANILGYEADKIVHTMPLLDLV